MTDLGISLSTVAASAYASDLARMEEIGASMGALSSRMDIGHSIGLLVTDIALIMGVQNTLTTNPSDDIILLKRSLQKW